MRAGRGSREHISNVYKYSIAQGSTPKMSNCSIDYTKDIDSVQHLKM